MTRADTMAKSYIEAIYFTETGDTDQPEPYAELTPACKAKAYIDCGNFMRALERHPENEICNFNELDPCQLGHDLWLTRNGHGTGFWDRKHIYGHNVSNWLTAMAGAMGEHYAEFVGQS